MVGGMLAGGSAPDAWQVRFGTNRNVPLAARYELWPSPRSMSAVRIPGKVWLTDCAAPAASNTPVRNDVQSIVRRCIELFCMKPIASIRYDRAAAEISVVG